MTFLSSLQYRNHLQAVEELAVRRVHGRLSFTEDLLRERASHRPTVISPSPARQGAFGGHGCGFRKWSSFLVGVGSVCLRSSGHHLAKHPLPCRLSACLCLSVSRLKLLLAFLSGLVYE